MPYVQVPKDLSKVKKKTVLNKLTSRQAIGFGCAAIIGVPTYLLLKNHMGTDFAGIIMVILMFPFFMIAIFEKDGQPLETILKNYIETHFIRNKPRPYETENIYEGIKKQYELEEEVNKIIFQAQAKKTSQNDNAPAQKKISPDMKLSRKTKKEIADAIKKAKRDGKVPLSAQQTIPYKKAYKDGILQVEDHYFTMTIQFFDINYQLAADEDKNNIFEKYCDFLNYFDNTVHFQLSFVNLEADQAELEASIEIPFQDDGFNAIRKEYFDMLREQLSRGNNGIVKTKYITYGVKADNYKAAKSRLETITIDLLNRFKRMDVIAKPVTGYNRLKLFWKIFHPAACEKFLFNWDASVHTGLSSKDFIAPTSFDFTDGPRLDAAHYFRFGDRIGAVSYISIMAPDLDDRLLAKLLDIDSNIIANIHIDALDQDKAIKLVKGYLSEIQKIKADEQKKANQSGYDMDILPAELLDNEEGAKSWLEDLRKRNERMFNVTFTVMQSAKTKKELDNNIFKVSAICKQYNCPLKRLDNRQEQGFMSALPIGTNAIQIKRGLHTTSTAGLVPFTTQELFQRGEGFEPLYYGMNTLSNNMIMADRKKLKNPNGLILGTPGSGKSFSAKREMANAFLLTKDDILILDPEGEYRGLVEQLKGQVIKISSSSPNYVNPLDINLSHNEEDEDYDPLGEKSDFVLSMCELIIGGKRGLEHEEETIIDRCVPVIYEKYLRDPIPENMPILEDLYYEIKKQPGDYADSLCVKLELYVFGSLKAFNHRTNVDLNNRVICFDIKELGKKLRKLGMLIIQECQWQRVALNREQGKATRVYMDEFHLLLKDPQTAAYSVEIWKRFRKWGGIPSGITQNVKDLLASPEIENIFENSDFIYMLNQAHGDAMILAEQLGISAEQIKQAERVEEGQGLIVYGTSILPFADEFPKDTMLYQLMTTKLSEISDNCFY